jgi:hypothetical protein
MYHGVQCLLTHYPELYTHLDNYNCCVVIVVVIIIIIIIIIRHELGLDRPVSASPNSLFKGLPSIFVHLIYIAL